MARGKESQERRAAKVRRKGKLQDTLVSALTQERYRAAVRLLLAFWKSNCFEPSCLQDMDEACAHFVEAAWSEGDSLTLALQALAGLQWLLPNVKGHLRHSWRLAKAWAKAEPPARARPFTSTMLMGLIGLALVLGRVDIAALFAIGFDGFLRSGELFNMKVKHVTFARGKAILQLPLTKGGLRRGLMECIVIESSLAVALLKRACHRRPMSEFIAQSSPCVLREVLARMLRLLQLEAVKYTWYSLRRGGATAYFVQSGSMEKTLLRGRWTSSTVARLYIQDALAQAGELRLTVEQRFTLRALSVEVRSFLLS